MFVDSSGNVGDSTIAQDGNGNISVTSGSLTVNNTPGIGVWGESTAADGVHGVAHTAAASGVAGVNDALGGVGIWGQSTSTGVPLGYGVYGIATDGYGVYGISANRAGVYGVSTYGSGVAGIASGSGIGVWGYNNIGFAAYFEGHVGVLGLAGGGDLPLCTADYVLAFCSSSLRYKTDVRPFSGGLDIVRRLRPIVFAWKQGGMQDVGLAAEDVQQVEPLLTFRNDKGEIEGVKYNQLSAVFVNAFVEQQAEIQRQQEENKQGRERLTVLEKELAALRALFCRSEPGDSQCR